MDDIGFTRHEVDIHLIYLETYSRQPGRQCKNPPLYHITLLRQNRNGRGFVDVIFKYVLLNVTYNNWYWINFIYSSVALTYKLIISQHLVKSMAWRRTGDNQCLFRTLTQIFISRPQWVSLLLVKGILSARRPIYHAFRQYLCKPCEQLGMIYVWCSFAIAVLGTWYRGKSVYMRISWYWNIICIIGALWGESTSA